MARIRKLYLRNQDRLQDAGSGGDVPPFYDVSVYGGDAPLHGVATFGHLTPFADLLRIRISQTLGTRPGQVA